MNTSQTTNEKLVDELLTIKRKEAKLAEEKRRISKALKERAKQYGIQKIEGTLAVATIFDQSRSSVAFGKLTDELKNELENGGYVNHTTATILKVTPK